MLGNDVLKTYFNDVKHSYLQIESYDSFVQNKLFSSVLDNEVNIVVEQKRYIITFHNLFIDRPMFDDKYITPDECRLRDLSYETPVQVDINVLIIDENTNRVLYSNVFNRFNLFNLPVMIGSCLCNLKLKEGECVNDDGGYFIIKGKERVIISQERINYNQIYVYENSKAMSEIRSIKEGADYSVLFQLSIAESMDNAYANLSYIAQEIPLGIFLKALNVDIAELISEERDEQFREWVDKILYPYALVETNEALEYISQYVMNKVEQSKKIAYTEQILTNELLPHLGIESDNKLKCLYILMMLRKTYNTAIGKRQFDHRDHLSNKRVECTGDLINYLVKGFIKRFIKMIEQNITKKQEFSNPVSIFNRFNFTQRMYQCFSTGTWGLPKSTYVRQGVCQILSRLSFLGYLSHIRRIAVPIAKDSRNTEVRQVHSSSYGFVDVVESPEGASAGIVKNFGLVTKISEHIESTIFHDILVSLFPNLLPPTLDETIIYINGVWIGNIETYKTSEFIQLFKSFRMLNMIHKDICISYNDLDNEIYINTDGGRILRGVINNQKGVYQKTKKIIQKGGDDIWETLQDENIIVFIDSDEADMSYINMDFKDEYDPKYDYIEIHPSTLLGTCSNWTIFPEHSQAPRNLYSAAQMKQGMSMYALSHNHRFDTTAHVLDYPQSRFVSTQFSRETGAEEMANGANAIVAVMTYGGWNQEDSVILNKSAIERGLFRATTYKSISSSEKKKGTYLTEMIEWVPPEFRKHQYDYSKIGMDGIVNVGEYVTQNDVLVGRIVHESNQPKKDCSLICPNNIEGVVDKVMVTVNAAGYKHVKIKVRKIRIPEIGDKHACYHPSHEVLTSNRGWISVSDVNMDDTLYTLNPDSHQIEFHKPNEIYEYDFDGQLYLLENRNINLCVTLNHRMYVKIDGKYRLSHAENVMNRDVTYKNMSREIKVEAGKGQLMKYDGKIYCVNVPNHILYVRRNGKSVWCGNSGTAQKGTCKTGKTPVSLQSGLSRPIQDIQIGDRVWGWNGNGLATSVVTNKQYMGVKPTLRITYETGETLECTPEHRILTTKGWKEARDLTETDKLISNLTFPTDIVEDDERNWTLQMKHSDRFGDHILNLSMNDNREQCLLFARILGYVLSDGWICRDNRRKNKHRGGVSLGTKIDCELFIHDVKTFLKPLNIKSRDEARYYDSKSYAGACFVYELPNILVNWLASLEGIQIGRRTETPASLPVFLKTAPKCIIREFLGGFFGGDGCAPYFTREMFQSVEIYLKTRPKYENELMSVIEQIQNMLKKFNISSNTSSLKRKTEAKDRDYSIRIGLKLKRTSRFMKNIGFRYSMSKQTKLCVASSYWQRRAFTGNGKEGSDGISTCVVRCIDWLEKTNSSHIFEKGSHCIGRYDTEVPYFEMPIHSIENIDEQPVYDITVKDLESFIANGIVTHNCSMLMPQEDMPFTPDGISPDLIINPHAIPSRMTINMMMEILLGKSASYSGELQDGTAFCHTGEEIVEKASKILKEAGYDPMGWETMTNGMTGEQLKAKIFIGPSYYMRLKHLVSDKLHQRSRGNVQKLTRQPCSGRSRDGGLRFGEMERDCMISHGTSTFLKERLFDMSDPYQIDICTKCGINVNHKNQCMNCDNDITEKIHIPYACKLLFQELQALGTKIRYKSEY